MTTKDALNENLARWKVLENHDVDAVRIDIGTGLEVTSIEIMEAYALESRTDAEIFKELGDFASALSKREGVSKKGYEYLKNVSTEARNRVIDIRG